MAKKKPEAPKPTDALVLRMSARLSRLEPSMRDAYVARAKALAGSKHPTRNAAAVLAASGS